VDVSPALPVALPLLAAAALAGGALVLPRRVVDVVALLTAAVVAALCVGLLAGSADGPAVTWFGGWAPRGEVALGISFVVDPIGSGAAALAGVLVVASLLYTWRHFETAGSLFQVLILVYAGGAVGFVLSGDIFNMFVFFELVGVAGFALTGFKIDERAPLQGALNFAVVNSIGGLLVLVGVALVYGRTGALNLAQIGQALAGRPVDGLVVTAFALLASGFLVKAAAVPFHFWLADAYAVSPTPVCILYSGVTVPLGLYGVARVYWTVFSGTLGPQAGSVRGVLLVTGAVTAVVGGVMSFEQRHLRRMLAFSTIAHGGLFLVGVALLSPAGMAAAAEYVLGHGATEAALFVALGVVLHRLGSVDEDDLLGRGHRLLTPGITFALGGLALAGLWPFGTAMGKEALVQAADRAGHGWVTSVVTFTAILTGGAVLRAAGRVFLGLGRKEDEETPAEVEAKLEQPELKGARGRTPAAIAATMLVLAAASATMGLVPGLRGGLESSSARFQDRRAYAEAVLFGEQLGPPRTVAERPSTHLLGFIGTAAAVAVAAVALFRWRLPPAARRHPWRVVGPAARALRAVHSGHTGDYVAWLTLGVAAVGGALALST
jgi:multicomponent Na+:H+ antiporter subunit D